jgi:peptidoglycan/LPS O-acetylase OafA/YrhL
MPTHNRVNEIDLLRFLAALTVVFFHYAFRGHAADSLCVFNYPALIPAAKYGYLGVNLFFMISGFVIYMTVATGSLRHFVVSRAARLYPAFWICCTVTFIIALSIGGARFHVTGWQYALNMVSLGSANGVPAIDGAYWSLLVEIKFYMIVAFAIALGATKREELALWVWSIVTIVIDVFHIESMRSVFISDYASYFIAGATCFLVWRNGPSFSRILLIFLSWALSTKRALATAVGVADYYKVEISHCVVAIIVGLFFILMLIVALKCTGPLRTQRFATLGGLSYPLYLVHQFVGYMIFNAVYPAVPDTMVFWAVIGFMLALSFAVHRFVERPLASEFKKLLELALRVRTV